MPPIGLPHLRLKGGLLDKKEQRAIVRNRSVVTKKAIDSRIQEEIAYAATIMQETGCDRSEALRVARNRVEVDVPFVALAERRPPNG